MQQKIQSNMLGRIVVVRRFTQSNDPEYITCEVVNVYLDGNDAGEVTYTCKQIFFSKGAEDSSPDHSRPAKFDPVLIDVDNSCITLVK